jgi:hypothetical protein
MAVEEDADCRQRRERYGGAAVYGLYALEGARARTARIELDPRYCFVQTASVLPFSGVAVNAEGRVWPGGDEHILRILPSSS